MICEKCKKSVELNKGFFRDAGMVPGLNMKRQEFVCNECKLAIDNTSRNPGEDDEPVSTDW